MNHDFSTAFLLLAVGMITVFSILTLITLFGKWLILIINRYFPEKIKETVPPTENNKPSIHPKKLAAIVAAVEIATRGKGKVTSVKKAD